METTLAVGIDIALTNHESTERHLIAPFQAVLTRLLVELLHHWSGLSTRSWAALLTSRTPWLAFPKLHNEGLDVYIGTTRHDFPHA